MVASALAWLPSIALAQVIAKRFVPAVLIVTRFAPAVDKVPDQASEAMQLGALVADQVTMAVWPTRVVDESMTKETPTDDTLGCGVVVGAVVAGP